LQRREQGVDIGDQNIGGAPELHGEASVEHVGTGQSLMHETRVGADELGQMRQKCYDVVFRDALDLVNAGDVEVHMAGLFPDRARAFLGNHANFGQGVAGMRFDLEPDAKPCRGGPHRDHFGPGIARYHAFLSYATITPNLACARSTQAAAITLEPSNQMEASDPSAPSRALVFLMARLRATR